VESPAPEQVRPIYRIIMQQQDLTELRTRPRDSKAHNDLAVELAGERRYDEAIGHYQEALAIRPDFPEALNNLGNALALAGRRNEAIMQYRKALALRPGWSVPLQSATPGLSRISCSR